VKQLILRVLMIKLIKLSGQSIDSKIDICCFSDKNEAWKKE